MNELKQENIDVLIIGAGPSGSMAAALLNKANLDVVVVEKQSFPRFCIGESLLPQVMSFLEKADLLETVVEADYQYKDGAAFRKNGDYSEFNFEKKFSPGHGTTFQVKRAHFDKLLADQAEKQGVSIRYQHEVLEVETHEDHCLVLIQNENGENYRIKAGFVLDASGFGRVLPRLLDLESPSDLPVRKSVFCHIRDNIADDKFDRNKILISVHPQNNSIWYWLIPFSDGTSSIGVVAEPEYFDSLSGDNKEKLLASINQEPDLKNLLANNEVITDVQEIVGYSKNVKTLHGKNFALLGNAGEFLDPVFSSGVTIAFKSADIAASLLTKQNHGESVCWENDYAKPLMKGVDTFRAFVNGWYDGSLLDIIFFKEASDDIREMVCSVLAGYAWDENNPYVAMAEKRLKVLAEICKN